MVSWLMHIAGSPGRSTIRPCSFPKRRNGLTLGDRGPVDHFSRTLRRWLDATQWIDRDVHGVADHDVRFFAHIKARRCHRVGDDPQELGRSHSPGFVGELTSPESAEGLRLERIALDQE